MVKIFIKGFILGFLTYCAATLVYIFAMVLKDGSITIAEPNIPWLITELAVAVLVTIGGVILIILLTLRTNSKSKGVKDGITD